MACHHDDLTCLPKVPIFETLNKQELEELSGLSFRN